MTETQRVRRRAVRSAGPPAEETTAQVVIEKAGAATAVAAHPVDSARGEQPRDAAAPTTDSPKSGQVDLAKPGADAVEKPEDAQGAARRWQPFRRKSAVPIEAVDKSEDAATGWSRAAHVALLAACAVLTLLLLTGAGVSVYFTRTEAKDEARRAEYVQTARQAVINLTTIHADSAKQDIDRILSVASGEFRSEFDKRVDPFASIVQQAKVVSNGEVVEAAIESEDDDSARVLVAAKQTLTNAGDPGPQTRNYRFRVTVTRTDAGLKASKVEFVA
ncbi:hypothetical protein [Nocardia arthritidis]|uniref:Mce protein n=1 Tax=Nocardia arthritidis TaxID=228602 RepID=A0A6G9Y5P4_9NOCA|nr:hypothetical protein [Nocardia arthritidis]QIS08509.1 hypothetical protein F5544_02945 [Nocardia arthritidis]